MTYQVLARKWRPQDFSALIGQEPIVTALSNALRDGRIAQAYLFSGIRGVGKTTAARVFAKALNCERGPAENPCNDCTTCQEITAGTDLDVLEVDAATYSKVEQVRELTESLKYGPARDRYKVVVLDEVHRLSRQAFDALLKIIEEPPAHLVFVFATTEIEAVPATVLSRCQEFHFRRVSGGEMSRHLRSLAEAEGIEVSDPALRLISRAGEGSVRDSVALLDQLAVFGNRKIEDEDAARLLGGLDLGVFRQLLLAMVGGDGAAIREIVAAIENQGRDPRAAYGQFLTYCREALHLALGSDPASLDLPHDESVELAKIAGDVGYGALLRLLHVLLASETLVRRSEVAALALEVAWLRAAELPRLIRIESILSGQSAATDTDAPAATGRSTARRVRESRPETEPSGPEPGGGIEPDEPAAPSADPVAQLLARAGEARKSLKASLEHAEEICADGKRFIIRVTDEVLEDTLRRQDSVLTKLARKILGNEAGCRIERVEGAAPDRPPPTKPTRQRKVEAPGQQPNNSGEEAPPAEVARHPAVQSVLRIFDTEIESIERRGSAASDQPEEP